MNKCEHEFEYVKDWRKNIEFDKCLRIPVICTKCGLKAEETWTDHNYTDKDTGNIIDNLF